jgi:hypothetical protein
LYGQYIINRLDLKVLRINPQLGKTLLPQSMIMQRFEELLILKGGNFILIKRIDECLLD